METRVVEPGTAPIGAKFTACGNPGIIGNAVSGRILRAEWFFLHHGGMNQPGSAMGIGDSIVSKVSTWRGGVTVNACEPHLLFRAGLSW